ncbi:MAG: hypothetical protein HQ522_07235 [Bacteroidetes bacterium]|nr:hypothetical protein [Bacteroidota bacterium]
MQKKIFLNVLVASILQMIFSVYIVYAVFYRSNNNAYNKLVALAVILFAIQLFNSGATLLTRQNYARILTVTNMLNLAFISFGGLLWIGFHNFYSLFRFIFWFILLFISFYFIYFLTRPNIKEQFKGVPKKNC